MNFDEIEKLWRSPLNQPTAEQIEKDKMKFANDLKKKHLGQIAFCAWIFAVLTFLTGKIIVHLAWPDPNLDRIDFTREWGVIPFLALPWIAWGYMVFQLVRHRSKHANYERSIHTSLQALLDENRMSRARNKFIAFHLALTALVMPLIIHQIKAVGKAGNEINVMYWAVPIIMGVILLSMWRQHTRKLLPEKQRLEELLKSYHPAEPASVA